MLAHSSALPNSLMLQERCFDFNSYFNWLFLNLVRPFFNFFGYFSEPVCQSFKKDYDLLLKETDLVQAFTYTCFVYFGEICSYIADCSNKFFKSLHRDIYFFNLHNLFEYFQFIFFILIILSFFLATLFYVIHSYFKYLKERNIKKNQAEVFEIQENENKENELERKIDLIAKRLMVTN